MSEVVTPWDNFLEFLNSGGTFTIFEWEIGYFALIAFAIAVVLTFFIFLILKKFFLRFAKDKGLPAEVYNGIMFLMRIFISFILIWVILTFLNVNPDYILVISGIIATAIAFASAKTINNFVAGIWIAFTQPYFLGDYVKIGDVKGIVVKISSFYTKIKTRSGNFVLIPNLNCLSSNILNYSLDISDYKNKIAVLSSRIQKLEEITSKRSKLKYELQLKQLKAEYQDKELIIIAIEKFKKNLELKTDESKSEYALRGKIIRYVFTINLPKKYISNALKLTELCDKWNREYNFHIQVELINITSHFTYEFTFITLHAMDIPNYQGILMKDIYNSIYNT